MMTTVVITDDDVQCFFQCFWLLAFSSFQWSNSAEEAPTTAPRPPKIPSGRPQDGPRRLGGGGGGLRHWGGHATSGGLLPSRHGHRR
eukprot:8851029-Pyramimonas_sp.AAC.1